jgi:hypothetical protein
MFVLMDWMIRFLGAVRIFIPKLRVEYWQEWVVILKNVIFAVLEIIDTHSDEIDVLVALPDGTKVPLYGLSESISTEYDCAGGWISRFSKKRRDEISEYANKFARELLKD